MKLTPIRNILYSKKLFWFGSDPVDTKALTSFKADKSAEVAHHVAAWASETGRGLLFFSEKSDKAAPHGVIQLVSKQFYCQDSMGRSRMLSII